MYAADGNPVTGLMARESIRALSGALPRIVADPADPRARADALYGAWLGGTVLGSVAMALHHKLCHTLGGRFNLPHAKLHTVLLPHAIAYNAPAAPEAKGHEPQAFMLIFAGQIHEHSIETSEGLIDIATRVRHPGTREAPVGGPDLTLVAIGNHPDVRGYCRSCAADPASGSPSRARPQSEPPQHGNSSPRQSS